MTENQQNQVQSSQEVSYWVGLIFISAAFSTLLYSFFYKFLPDSWAQEPAIVLGIIITLLCRKFFTTAKSVIITGISTFSIAFCILWIVL